MTLSVVHPNRLGTLPHDARWHYADDDLLGYSLVESRFGGESRLLSSTEFQLEIARHRSAFLVWLDQVLAEQPVSDWIPASFFKDMYSTPVFLHSVCSTIATQAIRAEKNLLIITRSATLARQLQYVCTQEKVGFNPNGAPNFWAERLRAQCGAIAHVLYYSFWLALRIFLARLMLGSPYRKGLRGTQISVETFLFEDDITPEGQFKDRFLPGLVAWYQRQGVAVASMPYTGNIPLRRMAEVYRRMKRCDILFAPGELFLQLRDLPRGMFHALRAAIRTPDFGRVLFEGMNISILAKYWWQLSALKTIIYQTWCQVPRRMDQYGCAPRFALDWYENQPLDKSLTIGFLRDVLKTDVIAMRQYFPAAGVVNFFSTDGEVRAGASPVVNWVCGSRTAELFSAHDSLGRYQVVPALRYSHLFEPCTSSATADKLVLFLTSSLEESLGIIACALMGDGGPIRHFRAVCIKPHQALQGNLANIVAQRWPDTKTLNIEWERRPTTELLSEAELVVTAGSSVALEALCRGVPVAVVGRAAGLNLNPLEDVDDCLWRPAYDSRDFARIVNEWLPTLPSAEVRRVLGNEIRDRYFQPPTASTMSDFLPHWLEKPLIQINA